MLHAVCAAFPDVKSYGGYRNESGYHGQGRAIDVMISGDRAWEIARWLRENAKSLGVIEVIHAQKIWTTQRASEGWAPCRTEARPRRTTTTTSTSRWAAEPSTKHPN